ncbi:HAMP domain-containing protein [Lujinxingia vulgaris]|uniref:HAMP domain-containing protein n=1 Tax=Lujinxingia vulgaris TaxID=2600176 RepID=A0A5C6X5V4_9DELT|nr:HAMP domain-containing protein [Lujinxingia vulgaris]TXD34464.1 HAMP domain-containing protein [Lujinxingia vulgaris]
MRVRTEITALLIALLSLQILTSLGAIGLLSRMAPAIEQIIEENSYSIIAVEEMLVILGNTPVNDEDRERFDEAFTRASTNITESGERPAIHTIERYHQAALRGDAQARAETTSALSELARINHDSMARMDERAKRMGISGAWAAMILGVISVFLGLVFARRLLHRIVEPAEDFQATARAFTSGDLLRRVHLDEPPPEFKDTARCINTLLDEHQRLRHGGSPQSDATPSPRAGTLSDGERRLAIALLDDYATPGALLDSSGRVLATSRAALDLPDEARAQLRELDAIAEDERLWRRRQLTDELWLATLERLEA